MQLYAYMLMNIDHMLILEHWQIQYDFWDGGGERKQKSFLAMHCYRRNVKNQALWGMSRAPPQTGSPVFRT